MGGDVRPCQGVRSHARKQCADVAEVQLAIADPDPDDHLQLSLAHEKHTLDVESPWLPLSTSSALGHGLRRFGQRDRMDGTGYHSFSANVDMGCGSDGPGRNWYTYSGISFRRYFIQRFYFSNGAVGERVLIEDLLQLYISLLLFAPSPRPPRRSEKQYITVQANGKPSQPQPLPCWYDNYVALQQMAREKQIPAEEAYQVSDAEVFMTLVVPAYNEQDRLPGMLEEAVEYLEEQYGHHGTKSKSSSNGTLQASGRQGDPNRGWEILVVSDGSRDKTVETALHFARTHYVKPAPTPKGPWNGAYRNRPTSCPARSESCSWSRIEARAVR